jgi:hypothetical protein
LRAYFIDQRPSREAAASFGYTPGSFRVLCHQFRQQPHRPFFLRDHDAAKRTTPPKAPTHTARLRDQVVTLRTQNFSIYDIVRALQAQGDQLSAPAVWAILHEAGFAKLPRRRDDERPADVHPTRAAVADARAFTLAPREFRTDFGGLFLFVPMLVALGVDRVVAQVGLPGTAMVPAAHAMA